MQLYTARPYRPRAFAMAHLQVAVVAVFVVACGVIWYVISLVQ